MIHLLEGRVGSGKTRRILEDVVAATRRGERALFLVPEQTTLETELQLAARLSAPGFLTTEVLSPSRLLHRVNEAAGGIAGRVLIDDRGRAMALRAALHELDKSLLVYRGCGRKPGFVETLADFFDECSQGEIAPTDLRLAADALPEGVTRMKLYDLAALHDRYLDLLRDKFLDTAEAVELFRGNVHRVDFLREAKVFVDGFDILPPRTLRLLCSLASAVSEMTIALTLPGAGEPTEALFESVRQSRERLCDMARELGVAVRRETLPREAYQSPEIDHLEGAFDAYPVLPYREEPRDIALYAFPTPLAECEAAADAMLALHRDQNIPFDAMACVSGDETTYAPALRQALTERGIPFFAAQAATALDHPLARWWLAAMEAATTGYRYESMRNVLRSGWSGSGEDEADRLLNDAFSRGLRGNLWQRPGRDEEESLTRAREAVLAPLLGFERRVKAQKSAKEMAHAAYLLLEESGAYPRLSEAIDRLRASGNAVAAGQYAQVWAEILTLLDQAVDILGDREIAPPEFLLALRQGLLTARLAALPPTPGQVTVTTASRVKGCELQALFVLGLNDGVLPGVSSNEALLTGGERHRVNETARDKQKTFRGAAERDQVENFSLYAATTLPKRRLHLSFAQAGEDGNALRPSLFVARLKALFPKIVTRSRLGGPPPGGIPALWRAAAALAREELDDEGKAALRYAFAEPALEEETSRIRRELAPEAAIPLLGGKLWEELSGGLRLGVTRAERFARCPCLSFIESALRPAPLYEPGLRPLETGTFYHDALDRLTSAVAARPGGWKELSYEDAARLVLEVARPQLDALAETPGYDGGRAKARIAELARTLEKTAQIAAYHLKGSAFAPQGHELAFGGEKGEHPPLEIALEDGRVAQIEGRIDRVDLYRAEDGEQYLRVVDYKSGNAAWRIEDLGNGLQLQLPIYAQVAERLLNARAAGFFYSKIADPLVNDEKDGDEIEQMAKAGKLNGLMLEDVDLFRAMDADGGAHVNASLNKDGSFSQRSSVLPEAAFRALLEAAKDTLAELLRRMADGEIAPAPAQIGDKPACETCEYQAICLWKD